MSHDHSANSCATCDNTSCGLSHLRRGILPAKVRQAFVVDRVMPEFATYVQETFRDGDQCISPGIMGKKLPQYAWPRVTHHATLETATRHIQDRLNAKKSGGIRRAAQLKTTASIAAVLAKQIDHTATHLVISQPLLPFLYEQQVLGGLDSYDVLMTGYPMQEVQNRLDAIAKHSPTASDFRAPQHIVDAETAALAGARRIITPHYDLAKSFGRKGQRIAWKNPAPNAARKTGDRVAFIGPVIARNGAHHARELARNLDQPLVVIGQHMEGPNFWDGVNVEQRPMDANWLEGVGSIIHTAIATSEPRKLLQARVNGVKIYAEPGCGLAPTDYTPLAQFTADKAQKLG